MVVAVVGAMIEQQQRTGQRERIVTATGRLFRDKGYHGASMADIGKAVGLEKGSLYSHISSKQDVLRELVMRGATLFMAGIRQVAASDATAPVKVREAMRAHLRVVAEQPDLATVFLQEWQRLEGATLDEVNRLRADYESMWRDIVEAGVREGLFRADLDTRFAALLLLSAANWAYQWFDPQGALSADDVADKFTDIALEGMR
jgi:AcrR family transcriptional regulator